MFEATGGRGVDVVYDSVGKATIEGSIRSLRPLGVCVLFGHTSGMVECVDPTALSEAGSVFFTRPHMEHYVRTPKQFQSRAKDVLAWTAEGRLTIKVAHVLSLAEAREAHRLLEQRQSLGKIILRIA